MITDIPLLSTLSSLDSTEQDNHRIPHKCTLKHLYLTQCARPIAGITYSRYAPCRQVVENQNNLRASKPKGLNMIPTICYGNLCLREENLSFNNDYIINTIKNNKHTEQNVLLFHLSTYNTMLLDIYLSEYNKILFLFL